MTEQEFLDLVSESKFIANNAYPFIAGIGGILKWTKAPLSKYALLGTDGGAIFYSDSTIESYGNLPIEGKRDHRLLSLTFDYLHEVLHVVLLHPFRGKDKNAFMVTPDGQVIPIWNIATDIVVNWILTRSVRYCSKHPLILPEHFNIHMTEQKSAEDVYDELLQQAKQDNRLKEIFVPGALKANGNHESWANADEFKEAEIAAAIETQLESGLDPGIGLGNLKEILFNRGKSKQNYREILLRFLTRTIRGVTYRKPHRRLSGIFTDSFLPGKKKPPTGQIVIAVDTSGSVSSDEFRNQFATEFWSILRHLPETDVYVYFCDHGIQNKSGTCEKVNLGSDFNWAGGGGTSFVPVFEDLKKRTDLKVRALIYLTDTFGDFEKLQKPKFPVMWAVPSIYQRNHDKIPFGQILFI